MASKKPHDDDPNGSLFNGSLDEQADGGDGEAGSAVALHERARALYLNYALSVITSRALPDVRDGLKPVQRRILYTMGQQGLTPDAKHRKCAGVVGATMQNVHPHGDQAIYDALVRMAQPFVMRLRLVDGSGNFGSLDGDPPAAMRYTECRMAPAATELLDEIGERTVPFRPNYDGTKSEPVVLPARLPNLLVNGSSGIAVGMATNIPPHHVGEVCNALLKLLDNPELKTWQLIANDAIQGPDFPTGGRILNTRDELREIYKSGSGAVRLRATWTPGESSRSGKDVVVTSIPYGVNKSTLIEQIAQIIVERKMPMLLDVRDLSTDDVRIVLTLKRDADEAKVLAYLCKHTELQTSFHVNLTCLIPTENEQVGRPQRCDLREMLRHFLTFRLDVVTRRLENEKRLLEQRVHILEGFRTIFDALDEIIAIIRKSQGKADAADKIMARFKQLDAEQTDAILELKLYRLARLEVNLVVEELTEKTKRIREIDKLLRSEPGRWAVVGEEITALRDRYAHVKGDPTTRRLTLIEAIEAEPEFTQEELIVDEPCVVVVTRDGWIKRQREVKDLTTQRVREGDAILTAEAGSTRATIAFFSNLGVAYTARMADVPATTGYGEPIQKLFKLRDGERIVAATSLEPAVVGEIQPKKEGKEGDEPKVTMLAVTDDGYALRFSLAGYVEVSTRAGRRYARPSGEAKVVGVTLLRGGENVLAVTEGCRAMVCPAAEVSFLAGPGKGVLLIKLAEGDRVLGFKASVGDRDLLRVRTNRGAEKTISTAKYRVTSRGGRGVELQKNGRIAQIVDNTVEAPALIDDDGDDNGNNDDNGGGGD